MVIPPDLKKSRSGHSEGSNFLFGIFSRVFTQPGSIPDINGDLVKDPSKGSVDETSYTEKRTVDGVPMRCLPATLLGGLTLENCAVDTKAGLRRDGAGDPLVLHAREFVPGRDKMVVLTEPVSVRIGKPVSLERMALTGAK